LKKNSTEDIQKQLLKARDQLKNEFVKARTQLQKTENDLENYIKKNPKKAAAIAAGIGAVIATGINAVISRRKKRKHKIKKN